MSEQTIKQFEEKEISRITQIVLELLKEKGELSNKEVVKIINEEIKKDPVYEGLQDWNIHYSRERIKEAVLESKLLNQGRGDLSLSWFNFYVYFRLPAGIVVSFMFLFFGGLTTFFNLMDIAVIGTLFWGLKERKLWAYKMNFVVLIAETILRPLERVSDITGFIMSVILFGLIWLLPNWIYFKKRKYLFLYTYPNYKLNKIIKEPKNWFLTIENFCHKAIGKAKEKRLLGLAILALVIIAGIFYWFQLRPSQIRKECSKYVGAAYEKCLHKSGLDR